MLSIVHPAQTSQAVKVSRNITPTKASHFASAGPRFPNGGVREWGFRWLSVSLQSSASRRRIGKNGGRSDVRRKPSLPGTALEEQRCKRRLCAQGRGPRFVTSGDAGEGPWGPHGTLPRRRADAGEISQSPRKSQLRSQDVGLDWTARFSEVFHLFPSRFYCVGCERISRGGKTLGLTLSVREERVDAVRVGGTPGEKARVTSRVTRQGTEGNARRTGQSPRPRGPPPTPWRRVMLSVV